MNVIEVDRLSSNSSGRKNNKYKKKKTRLLSPKAASYHVCGRESNQISRYAPS